MNDRGGSSLEVPLHEVNWLLASALVLAGFAAQSFIDFAMVLGADRPLAIAAGFAVMLLLLYPVLRVWKFSRGTEPVGPLRMVAAVALGAVFVYFALSFTGRG